MCDHSENTQIMEKHNPLEINGKRLRMPVLQKKGSAPLKQTLKPRSQLMCLQRLWGCLNGDVEQRKDVSQLRSTLI